jgi:hypothetical protein
MQDMDTDITYNGVNAQTERIRFPQVSMSRLRCWYEFTIDAVTDNTGNAVTVADPIALIMDQFQLEVTGLKVPRVLDFRSTELSAVQTILMDGITQFNTLNSNTSITITNIAGAQVVKGFFDLPSGISTGQITSAPQLSVTMAPANLTNATELAVGKIITVSSFVATMRFYYEDDDPGFTEVIDVQRMAASARHQVPLPTFAAARTLIEDTTANDATLIIGGTSFRSDQPQGLIPDYNQIREEAASAAGANYLILEPVLGGPGSNLVIEKTTSEATNVYFAGVFANAQGV